MNLFTSFKQKAIVIIPLVLIVLSLPVTMFFLKSSQDTRSRATAATRLYFNQPQTNASVLCGTSSLDVMIDPGSNLPSIATLSLIYDPNKIQILEIKSGDGFPYVLKPLTTGAGTADITLTDSADPKLVPQHITRAATVVFKAMAEGSTEIKFDTTKTAVFSLAQTDQATENVLSSAEPVTINLLPTTCAEGSITPNQTQISPTETLSDCNIKPPNCIDDNGGNPVMCDSTGQGDYQPYNKPVTGWCPRSYVSFQITGIGSDSAKGLNNNPGKRTVIAYTVDSTGKSTQIESTIAKFNPTTGNFDAAVDLYPQTGPYTLKISSDNTLFQTIPGIQDLTIDKVTHAQPIHLISGDFNEDNVINLSDYNLLISCFKNSTCNTSIPQPTGQSVSYTDAGRAKFDMNADGKIDELDLNLFYIGLSSRSGD